MEAVYGYSFLVYAQLQRAYTLYTDGVCVNARRGVKFLLEKINPNLN